MRRVYLGGPIDGLSYEEATEWRSYAKNRFAEYGVVGVDPMRGKEHLAELNKAIDNNDLPKHFTTNPTYLADRDILDITQSDMMLANFHVYVKHSTTLVIGDKESNGTIWEMGLARGQHKPVIGVCSLEFSLRRHPLINRGVSLWIESLDVAIEACVSMLR